jgi:hypothetical protein
MKNDGMTKIQYAVVQRIEELEEDILRLTLTLGRIPTWKKKTITGFENLIWVLENTVDELTLAINK